MAEAEREEPSATVLVVDDDNSMRDAVSEVLAANGYHSYASAVDETLAAASADTSPLICDHVDARVDAHSEDGAVRGDR